MKIPEKWEKTSVDRRRWRRSENFHKELVLDVKKYIQLNFWAIWGCQEKASWGWKCKKKRNFRKMAIYK